jgi:transposase InsO family protein
MELETIFILEGSVYLHMNSITQDMKFRQSLMNYAAKYGVAKASRKYNKSPSYIYFWRARYDGTIESLACKSRRPHGHPNQHTPAELKLIKDMRRRNPTLGLVELWFRLQRRGYTRCIESLFRVMCKLGMFPAAKIRKKHVPKPYEQMDHPGQRVQVDVKVVPRRCIANSELRLYQYTAIDEFSRLRFLGAYEEQSTYSSADFLKKLVTWYRRKGVDVECVQTDNGFEFTNRFANSKRDLQTLFEKTAAQLGVRHKLIRPYTPRHNGKVERSHREDQKRFYDSHSFYSLADFAKQLVVHQSRSNRIPMRPLRWVSPLHFLAASRVQYV